MDAPWCLNEDEAEGSSKLSGTPPANQLVLAPMLQLTLTAAVMDQLAACTLFPFWIVVQVGVLSALHTKAMFTYAISSQTS